MGHKILGTIMILPFVSIIIYICYLLSLHIIQKDPVALLILTLILVYTIPILFIEGLFLLFRNE